MGSNQGSLKVNEKSDCKFEEEKKKLKTAHKYTREFKEKKSKT